MQEVMADIKSLPKQKIIEDFKTFLRLPTISSDSTKKTGHPGLCTMAFQSLKNNWATESDGFSNQTTSYCIR